MKLYAGTAKQKITPEVGALLFGYNNNQVSHSVHDDLYATALALRYGDTAVVLLSADLCLINNDIADGIRAKAGQAAGIPAERVILSCTHTHSGPRTAGFSRWGSPDMPYVESVLTPACAAVAKAAMGDMHPVRVGIGTTESRVGINRRELLRDDTVILGHNPWGVYDPVMTVLSFAGEDGKPAANIVHYGAHPTASGVNHEITRDWPGVMKDRLETETGAVTVFLNGTLGDVAPRTASGQSAGKSVQEAMEVGGMAAIDALRAFRGIRTWYDEPMSVVSGPVSVPFLPPLPEAEARAKLAASGDSWSYPKNMYETLVQCYDAGDLGPDQLAYAQTLLRIGPVVFVPFPFETCSEIGLRLRRYSPFAHTLTLSCTNGSNSYLPPQCELVRGGYEVSSFLYYRPRQLPDDTDRRLIDANLDLMEALL